MHAEGLVFRQQTLDIAVGVVDVAEIQGARDATVDAQRRRLGVAAGDPALRGPGIDAAGAEIAFGGNAAAVAARAARGIGGERCTASMKGEA